jgi:hypothetical protein
MNHQELLAASPRYARACREFSEWAARAADTSAVERRRRRDGSASRKPMCESILCRSDWMYQQARAWREVAMLAAQNARAERLPLQSEVSVS